MSVVQAIEILSIVADLSAITLGIIAIVMSINSEKRSKVYFENILKVEKQLRKKVNEIDEEIDDYFQKKDDLD